MSLADGVAGTLATAGVADGTRLAVCAKRAGGVRAIWVSAEARLNPVEAGSAAGARAGTMTVMGSGPAAAFDRLESALKAVAKKVYRLGERAMVRIIQAEPITGGLLLELIEEAGGRATSVNTAMKRPSARKKPSNLKAKNRHPRQSNNPRRHHQL